MNLLDVDREHDLAIYREGEPVDAAPLSAGVGRRSAREGLTSRVRSASMGKRVLRPGLAL